MAPALRCWLQILAAVSLARGSRVAIPGVLFAEEDKLEEQSGANWSSFAERGPEDDAPDEDEDVDFSFMTNNFRYPGHESGGIVGTVNEWLGNGDRAVSDEVKEELVQGHICQKRGDRDQTYYASSLCYWLPEIKEEEEEEEERQKRYRHPPLVWSGGMYRTGKSLLSGSLSESGVCFKYSACHNNARGDETTVGAVRHISFVERVELPEGCLGEKEIESICIREFDEGSKELKVEDTRCQEIKGRFDRATKELAECTSALQHLPHRIESELPEEIRILKRPVIKIRRELNEAKERESQQLENAKRACGNFYKKAKGWMFADGVANAASTEQFFKLLSPADCADHLSFSGASTHTSAMCARCAKDVQDLIRKRDQTASWQKKATDSVSKISELKQELSQAKEDLELYEKKQPGLQTAKEAVDHEWLPEQASCEATHKNYVSSQSSHIVGCAPGFYDASCERACIEAQSGCGVIEGDRPGSENGNGNIQAACAPPEPSWIMGPFTYGSKEATSSQCERISAMQGEKYAQKVLKTGWLWKQGRFNKWRKRFFILESSDQVRSAVLRYYHDDPLRTAKAKESAGKGIIVWDAKKIKSKNGEAYGWKNGEECFKLVHFYRSFRLCVPRDSHEPLGTAGRDEKVMKIRDDWMDALADEMTHSDR